MSPRKSASSSEGGSTGEAAPPTLLFVDAIEGPRARVLWGVEAFDVPLGLLPAGTREGAWLHISFAPASAPPDDGAALRKKLSRDDDGGDIKL